jgi:Tfp pilus assembly protein PilO
MTTADLLAMLKKQPVGVACGLISLICAALLYFRSDKIDEYRAENEAKSAEATKILANVRNSEKLAAQVTEIQALSKELDGRLIHAGQLAANLQYFYKLEAETEVKLIDVRQGNPPKAGKTLYTAIPFSVAVQGSFKQVMAFLQKLENGPHFCHFTSVNFGRSVASSEAGKAGADATGTTLSLNLELLGVP